MKFIIRKDEQKINKKWMTRYKVRKFAHFLVVSVRKSMVKTYLISDRFDYFDQFILQGFLNRQFQKNMLNNFWVGYWQKIQDTTQTIVSLNPDGWVRVRKDWMMSTIFVYTVRMKSLTIFSGALILLHHYKSNLAHI